MSGTAEDTISGASFSVMVPGSGSPPNPAYRDLARLGAVDATDEPLLPADPAHPTGGTFHDDSIASPFSDGGLNFTIDTLQFVGPDAYLRVGQPGGYEKWLTTTPHNPAAPTAPAAGASDTPFGGNGIVLHSTDQIYTFAPSITQKAEALNIDTANVSTWTAGANTAIYYDNDRKSIAVLSGQSKDPTGIAANLNYQVVDNLSALVGNSVSTVGGSAATIWAGADASTGIGSLLWSNFGFTQNLFGGYVANITNGSMELQGLNEAKLSDLEVLAPNSIELSVAPIGGAAAISSGLAKICNAVAIVGGLVNAVLAVGMEATTGAEAGAAKGNADKLQKALDDMKAEMLALTGLTVALQIASTAAAFLLLPSKSAAQAAAASSISISNNAIRLSAGGTTVSISTAGFRVDAGDPALIADAAAKMLACDASSEDFELSAQYFLSVVSNPATAGLDAAATLDEAATLAFAGVPVPGVPTVTFNCLTGIKMAAPQIQFAIPT